MSYTRTDEHRRASAERARRHRPWTRSTGPTTGADKAASSMNRYRGAVRPTLREIARLLREQDRQRCEIESAGPDSGTVDDDGGHVG